MAEDRGSSGMVAIVAIVAIILIVLAFLFKWIPLGESTPSPDTGSIGGAVGGTIGGE